MRAPTFSGVLGVALLGGAITFVYVLARDLPALERPGELPVGSRAGRASDEASLRRHLQSFPRDSASWLELGQLLARSGRPDEARAVWDRWDAFLQETISQNPADPWWWYSRGWSLSKLGRLDEARDAWLHAVELFRTSPPGARTAQDLYNLACCLALVGDAEAALEALEHALAAGWRDLEWTRRDPDLESLHDDPRFAAILERMATRPRRRNTAPVPPALP